MKIHILGASASGVTTLGNTLAQQLNIPYFDSDEYFWLPTDPPFTTSRNPEERNELVKKDLTKYESWVYGGSSLKWGHCVFPEFDLIVFLWLPAEIRLSRLRQREFARYGSVIYDDPERHTHYLEFMDWAAQYDLDPAVTGFKGRSLVAHEEWLGNQSGKILEIRGDLSVHERLKQILDHIK